MLSRSCVFAQHKSSERTSKQVSLFGGEDNSVKLVMNNVPDWRPMEKLSHEFDAIGFYLSAHPLDAYSGTLDALKVKKATDVSRLTPQECSHPIRMAGTVVAKRERVGKRGNKFAFVMLSDDTGNFEVTMWSEVLAASRELLESGAPVLLTLDAQMDDERGVRLLCSRADPLEKGAGRAAEEPASGGQRHHAGSRTPRPAECRRARERPHHARRAPQRLLGRDIAAGPLRHPAQNAFGFKERAGNP